MLRAKILLWKLRSVIIASVICSDYLINEFMFENIQCDNMNYTPPSISFILTHTEDAVLF